MTDSGQGRAHYKALYEQTLKRLEDAEHEAEQWEDSYNEVNEHLQKAEDNFDEEMLKNEKLTKSNRILSASVKRTMEADWKNKYYALEEESLKEIAELKQQIKEMKPASTKTNKEWEVVFEATSKEISELKEKIADWELAARSADWSETPEALCNYLMYCGEPEEYNDLINNYDGSKKYIDILESRCRHVHNKFVCTPDNKIVDDEYIEERLKMTDNIDIELSPLFKQIKTLKEQIKKNAEIIENVPNLHLNPRNLRVESFV
jgi:hypothetical protein